MKLNKCKKVAVLLLMLWVPSSYAFDIVKSEAERDLVDDADIQNISLTAGFYLGMMTFENFNTSYNAALFLSYPFDEQVFVDFELGSSSISDTEYRNIGLPLFAEEDVSVTYYNVLIGYNIMPGEVYWSKDKTLLSNFYLLGGVGSTSIDSNNSVTLHLGAGFRVSFDNQTIRIEARDRLIDSDILGTDKLSHNSDIHVAIAWAF